FPSRAFSSELKSSCKVTRIAFPAGTSAGVCGTLRSMFLVSLALFCSTVLSGLLSDRSFTIEFNSLFYSLGLDFSFGESAIRLYISLGDSSKLPVVFTTVSCGISSTGSDQPEAMVVSGISSVLLLSDPSFQSNRMAHKSIDAPRISMGLLILLKLGTLKFAAVGTLNLPEIDFARDKILLTEMISFPFSGTVKTCDALSTLVSVV